MSFPSEDRLENEVQSLNDHISHIEKEIPSHETSVIHLRQCLNSLNLATVTLQNIHNNTIPMPSSASIGDDKGSKSSFHIRYSSSTSSQGSSSPTASRKDFTFGVRAGGESEHAVIAYADFQVILRNVAQAQSYLQQAAALTPRLPDIFAINLVDCLPFKETDFAKEGTGTSESRKDALVLHTKIYDALLNFHKYLDTVLPDLIKQSDDNIADLKARLTAVRASYELKKAELVAERKHIFDNALAKMEEASRTLEVCHVRTAMSPSSSKAVMIEEGGKVIMVADNKAIVLPS